MLTTNREIVKLRKLAGERPVDDNAVALFDWLDKQLDHANSVTTTIKWLEEQSDRGLRNLALMIEVEQRERA